MDKRFLEISEKVRAGIRLNAEDGLYLFSCHHLLELGQLADSVKKAKSGNKVFYNVNRHLNLTNVCTSRCRFCAFGVGSNDPTAYVMTIEEALRLAEEAHLDGATELHIVSALHPDLPFSYYLNMVCELHSHYPDLIIQAFTAVEIEYFSRISGLSINEVLSQLKEAGLSSLPGGGAEILDDSLRSVLCPRKADSQQWLDVHRTAHNLGIRTNATMLYGHIETPEQRIQHLLKLRELQDETGGFMAFVPLAFHPDNTELRDIKRVSAVDDLKTIAISRLMLDNFDHVKAFWIMLGIPIAQIALKFGADDLDGTVVEEKITHAAGATTDVGISREEIERLITGAGLIPVERDTLYRELKVGSLC